MRSTILFTATALASAVSARIVGLAAPAIIAPNDNITVTLITENYIQSVKDLSAAFALTPQVFGDGFIGVDYLGSFYLGPENSNVLNNLTFTVTTPADVSSARYLTGIVNSLYGASNGAVTYEWAVPITPGTTTSDELVRALEGINGNCFASTTKHQDTPPTSTPPPVTGDCFPSATQSLIQTSMQTADFLINSISQGNDQTGQQNLGQLNGFLGDVFRAIDLNDQGESACNNPTPPAWPPLSPGDSQARAIDILRNAQSALQALSGDVLECDIEAAFGLVCMVLRLVDNLDSYYTS